MAPISWLRNALTAPGGALADDAVWNSPALHAAVIPAVNGICDARSLARMYAACLGEVDGVRLLTPEQLRRATTPLTTGPDAILLDTDVQFGLGFGVNVGVIRTLGLGGPRAFGHFGAGGSAGWADPDEELGMGYVMNRREIGLLGDRRSFDLIKACYAAVP